MITKTPKVILASASKTRSQLLKKAGLKFTVQPADVDEAQIKKISFGIPVKKIARSLAITKAKQVSGVHTQALVIGADQILDCHGELFDKPIGRDGVRGHLQKLRGNSHRLISAACVVEEGKVVWWKTDIANLTMRDFSDEFIEQFIEIAGESAMASVGAYRIEDIGIQLFSRINGDYFTILGLPLLPLLDFLRSRAVLVS